MSFHFRDFSAANSVACGDSLDLIRRLPEASVDAVVTDPPYNIGGDFMGRGKDEHDWDVFETDAAFKMLWNHNSDEPCGVWAEIVEDEKGLKVSGIISETARGKDIIALLKDGAIDSLSIGYRTIDAEWKGETREIHKAELWEVSLVTFPMNELATIDTVKAASMSKRDLEEKLRDAGFSWKDAQKLISGGFNALTENQRDADAEAKSELMALLSKRAALLQSR